MRIDRIGEISSREAETLNGDRRVRDDATSKRPSALAAHPVGRGGLRLSKTAGKRICNSRDNDSVKRQLTPPSRERRRRPAAQKDELRG